MEDRVEVCGTGGVVYADLFMGNSALTYSEQGYGYAMEKAGSTQGWTFTNVRGSVQSGLSAGVAALHRVRAERHAAGHHRRGRPRGARDAECRVLLGRTGRRSPLPFRPKVSTTDRPVARIERMNVLRYDSESSWIQAICSLWRDRLHTKPNLKICLPSGTTPVEVYAEMSRSAAAGLVSFERRDRVCAGRVWRPCSGDPGGRDTRLQRQLIEHVNLGRPRFIFSIPICRTASRYCRDYDAAIGDGFDLVLLGIGLNGHLGMNEPDSPLDSPTRRVNLHETTIQSSARYFAHENLPRWGLTVGLKAILASDEVWLLAKGAAKASIIQRTVQGDITPSNPASLLRRHPNCSLFVDADAGALLNA